LGRPDGNVLIGGDIESGGTFGTTGTGVRTGRGLDFIDSRLLSLSDCLFLLLVLLLVDCVSCFGVSTIGSFRSEGLVDFLTILFGVVIVVVVVVVVVFIVSDLTSFISSAFKLKLKKIILIIDFELSDNQLLDPFPHSPYLLAL